MQYGFLDPLPLEESRFLVNYEPTETVPAYISQSRSSESRAKYEALPRGYAPKGHTYIYLVLAQPPRLIPITLQYAPTNPRAR